MGEGAAAERGRRAQAPRGPRRHRGCGRESRAPSRVCQLCWRAGGEAAVGGLAEDRDLERITVAFRDLLIAEVFNSSGGKGVCV